MDKKITTKYSGIFSVKHFRRRVKPFAGVLAFMRSIVSKIRNCDLSSVKTLAHMAFDAVKTQLLFSFTITAVFLSSCKADRKTGAELLRYTSGETDAYAYIAIDDKIFVPFSAADNSDRGEQIGIVNGDKKDKIYTYRDCSPDEWIIEFYDSGEMDSSMLLKEENVTDIPAGLTSEYPWNN